MNLSKCFLGNRDNFCPYEQALNCDLPVGRTMVGDDFFSTVPDLNFDMCMISSLRVKYHQRVDTTIKERQVDRKKRKAIPR